MFPMEPGTKTPWPRDKVNVIYARMRKAVIEYFREQDAKYGIGLDGKVMSEVTDSDGVKTMQIDPLKSAAKHDGAIVNSVLQKLWDEFRSGSWFRENGSAYFHNGFDEAESLALAVLRARMRGDDADKYPAASGEVLPDDPHVVTKRDRVLSAKTVKSVVSESEEATDEPRRRGRPRKVRME